MKQITFNEIPLLALFNAIKISLTYKPDGDKLYAGDKLYKLANVSYSFPDESQISSFTYGINSEATQYIDEYLTNLLEGMANYLNQVGLPENLVKEIVNIDNDHLMIVCNKNDSLQIHFNDATITCILHLTGQW